MLHTVSFCLKTLITGTNNIYHDEYYIVILVTGKLINISKKPTTSIFELDKKTGFFKGTAVRIPHTTVSINARI